LNRFHSTPSAALPPDYISGTTGKPKGCQHRTGGYLARRRRISGPVITIVMTAIIIDVMDPSLGRIGPAPTPDIRRAMLASFRFSGCATGVHQEERPLRRRVKPVQNDFAHVILQNFFNNEIGP